MRLTTALVILTALACASPWHWFQAGASEQQFNRDRGECLAQAGQAVIGIADGWAANAVRNRTFDSCMIGRGWVKKPGRGEWP